jgi:hypothetical protein
MVIVVQFVTSVLVLRGTPAQNIMLCILAQVYVRFFCCLRILLGPDWLASQCIAPTLIILRIGLGKAIDTSTLNPTFTSIQYADPPTSVADVETKKEPYQA